MTLSKSMLSLARKINTTSESFHTPEKIPRKEFYAPLVISFLICIIAYITYRLAIVEGLLAEVTVRYRTKLREYMCVAEQYKQENKLLRRQLNLPLEEDEMKGFVDCDGDVGSDSDSDDSSSSTSRNSNSNSNTAANNGTPGKHCACSANEGDDDDSSSNDGNASDDEYQQHQQGSDRYHQQQQRMDSDGFAIIE